MNRIYTLTAIHAEKQRHRCWGWFGSLETAIEVATTSNPEVFFEAGYYDHLAIEEVEEGIATLAKQVRWYRVEYPGETNENGRTVAIEQPEWAAFTVNFGIG